jgi:glutamate--cysteine ligase
VHGRSVQSLAKELIGLAGDGLSARKRLNSSGDDETGFLTPLMETVDSGKTPSDVKLELYHGRWQESVDPIYRECAY